MTRLGGTGRYVRCGCGILTAAVCAALAIGYFLIFTRRDTVTLSFSRADVQKGIGSGFPIRKSLLVVSAEISSPQVVLEEGSDRIGLGAHVVVRALGGRPVIGELEADGSLKYAAEQGAFYLHDARVNRIESAGIRPETRALAEAAATAALRQYLDRNPIYRLKPDDVRQAIAKRVLRKVDVRSGRVLVTLGM